MWVTSWRLFEGVTGGARFFDFRSFPVIFGHIIPFWVTGRVGGGFRGELTGSAGRPRAAETRAVFVHWDALVGCLGAPVAGWVWSGRRRVVRLRSVPPPAALRFAQDERSRRLLTFLMVGRFIPGWEGRGVSVGAFGLPCVPAARYARANGGGGVYRFKMRLPCKAGGLGGSRRGGDDMYSGLLANGEAGFF